MASWLSLWLIHPRPGTFTGGRGPRVRAGHEHWRTVVNGGAQYSKACEGASLPWVQIPPPPPLTCNDARPRARIMAAGTAVVSVLGHKWSQLTGPGYPRGWLDQTRTPALRCGGHYLGGDPGRSLSVQVEAIVQADARAKPGAGFPVSGRAAEPMSTLPKRAPWSSQDRLWQGRRAGLTETGRAVGARSG